MKGRETQMGTLPTTSETMNFTPTKALVVGGDREDSRDRVNGEDKIAGLDGYQDRQERRSHKSAP